MEKNYRVGTRTSPLALKQLEEIRDSLKKFYPYISIMVVGIDTYGDTDKTTPVSDIEGSDFFTREIDEALLEGEIDFAVHSAKDLPDNLKPGLSIAAITKSVDPFDALVSLKGLKLDELPPAARIGTSSRRRKEALKERRQDFQIVDIRGNIRERLKILDDETANLDAIVIASAGLLRLGLERRITERIPFNIIKPHPLQGALAVLARSSDKGLIKFLSILDRTKTALR